MIIFVIPLKAEATSSNWANCVERLKQTVFSCINQTNPNFRVLIFCDQKIDLGIDDDRCEFLVSNDIPLPMSWEEKVRNKSWKQLVAAVRIREILFEQDHPENGIYVMPVDADDLVSSRLAQFAEEHQNESGFVSEYGYVWHEGKTYMQLYKDMHRYCGSCNVIKMYPEDLPEKMPAATKDCYDPEICRVLTNRYIIRRDHGKVVDMFAAKGRPFAICPFPTTIYRLSTGDNISAEVTRLGPGLHLGVRLKEINPFDKCLITMKLKREFNLTNYA